MCIWVFSRHYHMFQLPEVQLHTTGIRRILDTIAPFSVSFRFVFIALLPSLRPPGSSYEFGFFLSLSPSLPLSLSLFGCNLRVEMWVFLGHYFPAVFVHGGAFTHVHIPIPNITLANAQRAWGSIEEISISRTQTGLI